MRSELNRFLLSSADCELLLEFEKSDSLLEVAQKVGRDHSAVSRIVKRIADVYPVFEKRAGKWVLTDIGRRVNQATRAAMEAQSHTLKAVSALRIGTNREFASRVMGPDFLLLQREFPNTELSIHALHGGTESALLNGQVDLAVDCDRPFSPDIAYRLVVDEPIVPVASPTFLRRHAQEIAAERYITLPHLLCERLHPDKIFLKTENPMAIAGRFNDIATARAACLAGAGWALLPSYCVDVELNSKALRVLDDRDMGKSKYGVWRLRGRREMKASWDRLVDWLSTKRL